MTAPVIDRPKVLPSDGGLDRSFWTHVETEFEKSCQVTIDGKDCEEKATWMCYATHSFESCPSKDYYFCEKHMQEAFQWWTEILKLNPAISCPQCNSVVSGNLSDHLRAIKL